MVTRQAHARFNCRSSLISSPCQNGKPVAFCRCKRRGTWVCVVTAASFSSWPTDIAFGSMGGACLRIGRFPRAWDALGPSMCAFVIKGTRRDDNPDALYANTDNDPMAEIFSIPFIHHPSYNVGHQRAHHQWTWSFDGRIVRTRLAIAKKMRGY